MSERNTPDRNDAVGKALRSLDVGTSRLDFWDDLQSDLLDADSSGDGIAPQWISGAEDSAGVSVPNGRRVWPSTPVLLLAAAAALLLIGGLTFVLRPAGDDTTQLDVANPDVVEPPVEGEETTSDAATTVPSVPAGDPDGAPLVDYSQTPTIVDLPAGSTIAAASPTIGLTLLNWPTPGGANGGCETAPGSYALLPAVGSGHVLVDKLANFGGQRSFTEGPNGLGVLTDLCMDQAQLAEFNDQGDLAILAWLQIPEGQRLMNFPAVWSQDGSQFHLHTETEAGIWSLLTFDAQTSSDRFAAEPVTDSVISDGLPIRLLAELASGVRVGASDGVISVADEPIAAYQSGEGPGNILAKRSPDGLQVAIAANGVLTIADAGGVVAGYEAGGPVIQAIDWSSTGQLLFSLGGIESGVYVYTPGPEGADFAQVANTRGAIWFELEVADNGTMLALSGFNEIAQAKILTFPGNQQVPALDPDARLITLEPPTRTIGDQPLSLRGMGAIETGMTVAQAEAAVGGTIVYLGGLDGCGYAALAGDPLSPSFMVITYQEDGPNLPFLDGVIERIELGPDNATLSGISIGSTEDEVRAAYGERIEVTPHQYTFDQGGEYFTFVPADEVDSKYRVVMETFDDKVTAVRSGLVPAVEFVEGCA